MGVTGSIQTTARLVKNAPGDNVVGSDWLAEQPEWQYGVPFSR